MKNDRLEVLMIVLVFAIIGIAIGIVALASVVAKYYGLTAGLLCVLLPIAAATIALIYLLVKQNKGEKQ